MAISHRDGSRDMRELARRIHQRWLEYRRRYPGRSVPINDTLSRILEYDPEYRPPRPRKASNRRPPLRNPGVFTLREIANSLQTTVGDLLGERGYAALRDVLPVSERRRLRDAVALLRDLFDLDDESLGPAPPNRQSMAGDFLAPEPLHVWMVPAPSGVAASTLGTLDSIREVFEPRIQVLRLTSDAMAPELPVGAAVLIDSERTTPSQGDLVAVSLEHGRNVLGRWDLSGDKPALVSSNPAYPPLVLDGDGWKVLGIVTGVVGTTAT